MINIRQLQKYELPLLINALKLEDWHVEITHINCLYENFSNDFFIAYKDSTAVGFICAIKYTEDFGLISNFVVLKKFRSLGFGRELFNFALSHLDGCQIALESSLEDEYIYVKKGFKSYYDTVYYSMEVKDNKKFISNFHIKNAIDTKEISAYLNCVARDKKTITKAIYNDKTLSSYGMCTRYGDGHKVIISSKSNDEALEIFFSLIENFEVSTKIYMEITKLDIALINIVDLLRMKEYSIKRKMYNKVLD